MVASVTGRASPIQNRVGDPVATRSYHRRARRLAILLARRVLTPVTTVQLFLLQILHGNTACSHLPPSVGITVHGGGLLSSPRQTPGTLL